MKRLILIGAVFLAFSLIAGAEETKFSTTVTPGEFAAAGLSNLSPAQLAQLDALIEKYKNGELAAARQAAADALAAKRVAEAEAAKAQANAAARIEAARTETAKAEATKPEKSRGLMAKAKSLFKSNAGDENAVVQSTIVGKFRGWQPKQVFVLANGQRWQIANNDHYFTPAVENPKVIFTPASFGGYWMWLPDLGAQVRVNFLGDK